MHRAEPAAAPVATLPFATTAASATTAVTDSAATSISAAASTASTAVTDSAAATLPETASSPAAADPQPPQPTCFARRHLFDSNGRSQRSENSIWNVLQRECFYFILHRLLRINMQIRLPQVRRWHVLRVHAGLVRVKGVSDPKRDIYDRDIEIRHCWWHMGDGLLWRYRSCCTSSAAASFSDATGRTRLPDPCTGTGTGADPAARTESPAGASDGSTASIPRAAFPESDPNDISTGARTGSYANATTTEPVSDYLNIQRLPTDPGACAGPCAGSVTFSDVHVAPDRANAAASSGTLDRTNAAASSGTTAAADPITVTDRAAAGPL